MPIQPLAVQYRIGDSGAWVTVPAGSYSDVTTGPSAATLVTAVTVALPAEANNQSQLQIRIITTNAVGSDEWVGIDDINVTSSALAAVSPGTLSIGDAQPARRQCRRYSDLLFTVTRTGGSDGAVSANWSVSLNGTADSRRSRHHRLSGTVSFAGGPDQRDHPRARPRRPRHRSERDLFGPARHADRRRAISDGLGIGTIRNDDLPPAANVFINEINYDPAGTDTGEFVEVAGLAGTDLTGWTLVLYNGNGGGPTAR